MPSVLKELQEMKLREALEEASEDGFLSKSQSLLAQDEPSVPGEGKNGILHSRTLVRLKAQRDFLAAFAQFKKMYPKFESTEKVDELRSDEYGHLEDSLKRKAHDIRGRIMDYLSIPQSEYSMVFTVSRGSAFKLLAESYPFQQNRRLLTMYDYESESVNWMAQSAREKGAKVHSAWFKWPTLRLCSTELRKQLQHKKKRRKDSAIGLFVFPVQSRVTGAKYSYQWMSLAQQNKWHVLLDAGALGPKDMDSLGLSLFRPDFIITSFYKVFGADPTGFGCLFIKNSVIGCLQNKVGASGAGMVRIVPVSPQYLSDSAEGRDGTIQDEDKADGSGAEDEDFSPELQGGLQLPAFSGPFSSSQVRDVFESEMDYDNSSDRDGASTICDEMDNLSVEEIMKSPVFSEEENENLVCIDLGESPLAPKTSDNFKSSPFCKLGLRQLHDGFSRRTRSKQLANETRTKSPHADSGTGPIYDEEKQDSCSKDEIISFDAAVSSVSQDHDQAKAASVASTLEASTSAVESHSPLAENGQWAEAEFSFQDDVKDKTLKKSGVIDPGESHCSRQEKLHADPNHTKTNGNCVTHGSYDGNSLILKDEMGLSKRMHSQRFPKQTKITFNLDYQGPVSMGHKTESADVDRGGSHISELHSCSAGEVSRSISVEITSCNEDDKHVIHRSSNTKDSIANASASLANGFREPGKVCFTIGSKQNPVENGCKTKENSIRRETEGAYRLLGRREEDRFSGGRFSGLEEDGISSSGRRVPFSRDEYREREVYFEQSGEESEATPYQEDEIMSAAEVAEEQQWTRREPQILCKHLDHVDMMGLNKTTLRLRYLINWLVTSLLQLRHPGPDGGVPLVHIYGPKIRYDRGAAVAFNLYDHTGTLVNPELVQKLAEKNRISLGLGFLSHLRLMENYAELQEALDSNNTSFCKPMANGRYEGMARLVKDWLKSLGMLDGLGEVWNIVKPLVKIIRVYYVIEEPAEGYKDGGIPREVFHSYAFHEGDSIGYEDETVRKKAQGVVESTVSSKVVSAY